MDTKELEEVKKENSVLEGKLISMTMILENF
jgi:hypothetical protein